ncbi:ACP phosphodiesterase [Jiulongibacter sediminis]|uniref:acyl carrier protein phosphodiesterase n=1 Tax=Jiulongibacter sediminis TaxID=1605367 RepID=UPI0026F1DA32|nr:ACP phosphodiesterase [Jiulongibacter sediminis]
MNYLAHVFLSGQNEAILFGNMLEDFMHGRIDHPRNNHLSSEIKKGIKLHRFIDTFTDTHELVKESKKVFQAEIGRYASVTVDVIYDHYLIKNWSAFSDEDFKVFRFRVYDSLVKFKSLMPERLLRTVESMITYDWLKEYEFDEGLSRAFESLNRKIKNGPDMLLSIPIMHENYDLLNEQFLTFFEELKAECELFIEHN